MKLMGYNRERSKYFQNVISQDLMHACISKRFSPEKMSHFLLKLDNRALGHQIPRLVTYVNLTDHTKVLPRNLYMNMIGSFTAI